MSGDVRVPVKSWLRAGTYRTLLGAAKRAGLRDVGQLLEHLADRAALPPNPGKRTWTRMTPERLELLHQLVEADTPTREIATRLGVSVSTIYNYTHHRERNSTHE